MTIYQKLLNHQLLSPSEEQHLIGMAHQGCMQSRERLILLNMRLVHSVCRKYETEYVSAENLIGDGVEGLIKAIDGFDPTLGTRLSTYATFSIHTTVGRSPLLQATIRLPNDITIAVKQVRKVIADLTRDGNHTPTNEEIAEKINKLDAQGVAKIRLIIDTIINATSLDAPVRGNDGDNRRVIDFLEYKDPNVFDESININEIDLEFFLSKLQREEAFALTRSYGIPCKMTQIEIAEALHTRRYKIPVIRDRALKKCQRIAKYLKSEYILTGCENWAAIMTDPEEDDLQMEFIF